MVLADGSASAGSELNTSGSVLSIVTIASVSEIGSSAGVEADDSVVVSAVSGVAVEAVDVVDDSCAIWL